MEEISGGHVREAVPICETSHGTSVLLCVSQILTAYVLLQANGDAKPSILSSLLAEVDPNEDNSEKEETMKGATFAAYIGKRSESEG